MILFPLVSIHQTTAAVHWCIFPQLVKTSLLTVSLPSLSFIRHEFDSEQIPDLTKDVYIQDIHCVGSLCKLYFRELPNPLLTYQLYEKFSVSKALAGLNTSHTPVQCVHTSLLTITAHDFLGFAYRCPKGHWMGVTDSIDWNIVLYRKESKFRFVL